MSQKMLPQICRSLDLTVRSRSLVSSLRTMFLMIHFQSATISSPPSLSLIPVKFARTEFLKRESKCRRANQILHTHVAKRDIRLDARSDAQMNIDDQDRPIQ